MFGALRRTWQPVANAANLPPGGVTGATLLDTELVLARFANGRLLDADVACPHKGARLSGGCVRDGEPMCAYHGWRFDSIGACQLIPSLFDPNPAKLALSHLRTHAVGQALRFHLGETRPGGRPRPHPKIPRVRFSPKRKSAIRTFDSRSEMRNPISGENRASRHGVRDSGLDRPAPPGAHGDLSDRDWLRPHLKTQGGL
ncbi:MAG TPA: Rieske (2Fe-2S) protein [Opitutus sp.]|nr:Rieske (2Fe-2S) protein [Opitutus sp.]